MVDDARIGLMYFRRIAVAGGLDCPSAGRLRAAMVPALKPTDGPRCRSAGDRGFLHGLATTDIALFMDIQKCDTARAQCDGYKASSLHLVTVMEHDDS
jgi:hypothetical protein